MLSRVWYPNIAILGKLPDREQYVDIKLHPEARQMPDVLICRVEASIIFANAKTVKKELLARLEKAGKPIRLFVLDMAPTPMLDITGMDMLDELEQQLAERGVTLRLANVSGLLRDILMKAGFEKKYGKVPERKTIGEVIDEWISNAGK